MEGGSGSTDTRPGFVPVQVVGREGHGVDVESTKEGRMPTLVTQEAEKSTLQYVVDSTKKARMPTQVTPEAEKSTLGHVVESTKEARIPIQVTCSSKEIFFWLERDWKCKRKTDSRITEPPKQPHRHKAVKAEEFVADNRKTRQPTQAASEAEKPSVDVSELETWRKILCKNLKM